MVLTDAQKQAFINDGYLILRGAVPREVFIAARQSCNRAYRDKKWKLKHKMDSAPSFEEEAQKAPEIPAIVTNSILEEALSDLLGAGNPRWGAKAQIAFRTKDQKLIKRGMKLNDSMDKFGYHVDGGNGPTRHNGSPFTILMGICLSPGQMQDENRGQLNVWPGSHIALHDLIKDRASKGLIDGPNTLHCDGDGNLDIGQPIRVLLKPGDAVLAHQRLGHAGGINLVDQIRKNLYFRVRHKKHKDWVEQVWRGSVWKEFEGLHPLVGYQETA